MCISILVVQDLEARTWVVVERHILDEHMILDFRVEEAWQINFSVEGILFPFGLSLL